MKKIILALFVCLSILACKPSNTISGNYGDTSFDKKQAISSNQLQETIQGKDSLFTVVEGNITAACQAKGCWLKMDVNGEDMLVKFKDYGFFVPKNSADHHAIISGWAFIDTITVAEQKELALDNDASQEEIQKINTPKIELQFVADGVIIE
jgi:hypothetical protein